MSDPHLVTFFCFLALVAALMALATFAVALYWLRKARRIYLEAERNYWRAQFQRKDRERL